MRGVNERPPTSPSRRMNRQVGAQAIGRNAEEEALRRGARARLALAQHHAQGLGSRRRDGVDPHRGDLCPRPVRCRLRVWLGRLVHHCSGRYPGHADHPGRERSPDVPHGLPISGCPTRRPRAIPPQWSYDRQRDSGTLYVWPIPDSTADRSSSPIAVASWIWTRRRTVSTSSRSGLQRLSMPRGVQPWPDDAVR